MTRSNGKKLAWAGIILLAVGVLAFGVAEWRSDIIRRQDDEGYKTALERLEAGRAREAWAIVDMHRRSGVAQGANAARWTDLAIRSLTAMHDVARLLLLYEREPAVFQDREEACLWVARGLIQARDFAAYDRLRGDWLTRGERKSVWFLLDADVLLAGGRATQAKEHLESKTFDGPADCGRLLRLALIERSRDPLAAWNHLAKAYEADPRNVEVRSFRGRMLEVMGKLELARVEYVAAALAEPTSAAGADQLASFYVRHENYPAALETWANSLRTSPNGSTWLAAHFWGRVSFPSPFDPNAVEVQADDPAAPLVASLRALEPGRFWNPATFDRLPDATRYARDYQECFWLRLLECLRTGDEGQILNILAASQREDSSWQPDLAAAIRRIVYFRRTRSLNPPGMDSPARPSDDDSRHPFFRAIDAAGAKERSGGGPVFDSDPELAKLLGGEEAFSAAFVAAAWPGAALAFHRKAVLSPGVPVWLAYGLTQAIRHVRGANEALEFAKKQASDPLLDLAIGELLIASGKADEGASRLTAIARQDSDAGYRAAWILGLRDLERGSTTAARETIASNPRLAASVTGREMLARAALQEGREDDAERIYVALGTESMEAQSYLARQAFSRRDWAEARRWTESLILEYPDELRFRANLEEIRRREAGS